ncbi:inositol monophosphatase family protein [Lysinimonas soli]|uniref:Inositol monophosphatase family protein n=1 Tax=Lysinimonas soli TaxID=1074233 RepID=A0ABW0NL95_9MICO
MNASTPAPTLADDLAVALTLAGEADLIAMDRYRAQDLDVQLKPDRTQVTDADTRVERMIRDHLAQARPGDSVFGEEYGTTGSSSRQWIVDPIDGTSNFVRGVPIWGLLLALVVDGVPQLGVVSAPALGRRWWGATGHGAWMQPDGGEPRRLAVSGIDELADATLSYNSLKGWDEAGRLDQLIGLSREVGRTRAFGDLWSYMLVAEGAVDIASEFDLKPWDIAALVPVIREAGGTISSVDGAAPMADDSILVTNGLLHARAQERLSIA